MPVPPARSRVMATKMRPLYSRTQIHKAHRLGSSQVRTLWWWGRQTSNPAEDFEERARTHHKIMRSRYYKLARRRAVWESEETYLRPWRFNRLVTTRYCDYKPLSSKGASSQQPNERDRKPESENASRTLYDNFDAFRAAVDRAVARDPYGTLFGRRLQSPPSSNNSSWTSFSWFTDSKEIMEDASAPDTQSKGSETATAPAAKPSAPATIRPVPGMAKETEISYNGEEYTFDPITMRKVPMKKNAAGPEPIPSIEPEKRSPASEAKPKSSHAEPKKPSLDSKPLQPFLQSLFFLEHGTDIPVKTFKPHKVYGYGSSEKKAVDLPAEMASAGTKREFDTSKKQKLRDLMSQVKGNNIDTTALFTEIVPRPELGPATSEITTPKKPRELPEPDDTLPLFSGTTYGARFKKEASVKSPDWLAKEGFRQSVDEAQSSPSVTKSATDTSGIKPVSKLEPALDRVHARAAQSPKDKSARLRIAVDREQAALRREMIRPAEEKKIALKPEMIQRSEDEKTTKRAKLQADFEARHRNTASETDFSPKARKAVISTSKLTKTINNVWEHIQEHPDGIVAKTMKSMTNLNENYKKYIRPDAVKGLTDKLLFKDESLSKTPSIYKQNVERPKVSLVTPSYGGFDAEQERQRRSASLREMAEKTKRDEEVQNAQISRLATEIQAVYESEYGPIDSNHRQSMSSPNESSSIAATSAPSRLAQQNPGKAHPLSTASAKPGVTTNPAIDEHINEFEPKFAELVDHAQKLHAQLRNIRTRIQELREAVPAEAAEATNTGQEATSSLSTLRDVFQGTKAVRKALHETKIALRSLDTRRPAVAWTAPQMSGSNFGQKRIDINARKASETHHPNAIGESDAGGETKSQSPVGANEKTVPEPVHTPAGSPIWNDEQIPPIEELRETKFDSPYMVLAFDPSTKKVTISPMNQPVTDMPKLANMIHILGRLQNASEFLKHFQTMQGAGYSIYNGTDEMLIFQKDDRAQATTPIASHSTAAPRPVVEVSTSTLSDQEATMQTGKEAATVLEELPSELDPPPGPAAPTAPPSRPLKDRSKVRRLEKVFSGTIQPNAATSSSRTLEGDPIAPQPGNKHTKTGTESLWRRFARAVKRTVLIVSSVAAGAYAIGVVTEGLSAHAQQQKGFENCETPGPRKRIVYGMGQRPGIFSTESSR